MRPPELRLHADELVIDNFAGGGGASLGIEWALGRSPDIAVNHNPEALAMHAANHPATKHLCEDVFDVDPKKTCRGRRVGLAWFSPDCTFHSKARGGKPFRDRDRARRRRGLAGVVIRWAKAVKPRVIFLENVQEFQDWGPLDADGKPDPARRGFNFRRWWAQLVNAGYQVEMKNLRACDFGAPTTRKRLFIIARSDGQPIVWPEPTHGPGREPYRTAAECIEWALPCPSIFERKRPLAENTLRRIARGLRRYVIEADEPFIIPLTHHGDRRVHRMDEPMPTVTGAHRGEHALVTPYLAGVGGRKGQSPETPIDRPYHTVTAKGDTALVAPYLSRLGQTGGNGKYTNDVREPVTAVTTKTEHLLLEPFLVRTAHGEADRTGKRRGRGEHSVEEPLPTQLTSNDFAIAGATLIHRGNGERPGQEPRVYDPRQPHPTVVAGGIKTGLGVAWLARHYSERPPYVRAGKSVEEPLPTITTSDHHSLVAAFLAKHYGGHETPGTSPQLAFDTVTSRDHHALVAAHIQRDFGQSVGSSADAPLPTVTGGGGGHAAMVASHLLKLRGGLEDHQNTAQGIEEPLPTLTAGGNHVAEVRAFLLTYYGSGEQDGQLGLPMHTVTTKDRFGLVTVHGVDYVIADIGMRMLVPRELFRAQSFPDSYQIEVKVNGKPLTKEAQVNACGNSVPPMMAMALVAANLGAREEGASESVA